MMRPGALHQVGGGFRVALAIGADALASEDASDTFGDRGGGDVHDGFLGVGSS
ncbi:MAG: hypothetical protein V4472_05620 [Pseudomonadota bacterium]